MMHIEVKVVRMLSIDEFLLEMHKNSHSDDSNSFTMWSTKILEKACKQLWTINCIIYKNFIGDETTDAW